MSLETAGGRSNRSEPPELSRGQAVGLGSVTSNLLFESPQGRLCFASDHLASFLANQDSVDPATRRPYNRNLEEHLPRRVRRGDQCLDHSCLVAVSKRRPPTWVEPHAQVGVEHVAHRDEHRDAGLYLSGLDQAEEPLADRGGLGQPTLADPGIETKLTDLGADRSPDLTSPPAGDRPTASTNSTDGSRCHDGY